MTLEGVIVNGQVRLDAPAPLPTGTRVRIEPVAPAEVIDVRALAPPGTDEALLRVYETLGRSYDTGDPEAAARHNEHQP